MAQIIAGCDVLLVGYLRIFEEYHFKTIHSVTNP
jgi:hypothetical protein